MPNVVFAPAIQRHQRCPPQRVVAATVADALDAAFSGNPALRDYILDDQARLRRHVAVFVDGRLLRDRQRLDDGVADSAEIYVAQALSGG